MSQYKPILDRCKMSEAEFINGGVAIFSIGNNPITVVAIYDNGNVLIEATTYQSLFERRRNLSSVPEPIVVEDPSKIEPALQEILDKHITTKLLYEDADGEAAGLFRIRRHKQEIIYYGRL